MSVTVIKPGLLDTMQDLGRAGYGNLGISRGGAMDHYAVQAGNLLAGNPVTEGVLEMHFPGPQLLFGEDALVCLTGADFMPACNDEQVTGWQPVMIRKNSVLQFRGLRWGARAYLSVHGGFDIEPWMNSYSTHLKAGAGGYQGRKLAKGDTLRFRTPNQPGLTWKSESGCQHLPWRCNTGDVYGPQSILFLPGNAWDTLTGTGQENMQSNLFTVHPASDRMGYRLEGVPLTRVTSPESISAAVTFGTIQLLPGGQLIILMADHQTTGGYPIAGNVITAHLPRLAQCKAGDEIRLKVTGMETAEALLIARHREIQKLGRACTDRLNQHYATH